MDVAPFFTDPDGDKLTYAVASSNPNVAAVSIGGSVVTFRLLAAGTATVTIAATDPSGLSF